jgi:hypothetical protein
LTGLLPGSLLRRSAGGIVALLLCLCIAGAQDLLYDGIEGIAAGALNPQKVPYQSWTLGFAVITHNVNDTLQIRWHGMFRNISSACFPGCRHALLRHHGLFTDGASVVKSGQFTEAMGMNCMSTGQILRRLPGGEHIFPANGTIVLVLVLETLMRVENTHRDTHATFIAVAECFHSSHTAESTAVAMEGFLAQRHPQVTHSTIIFAKLSITINATVSGTAKNHE